MKKCPFCAEDIQDAAIKCKHCGSMTDGSQQQLHQNIKITEVNPFAEYQAEIKKNPGNITFLGWVGMILGTLMGIGGIIAAEMDSRPDMLTASGFGFFLVFGCFMWARKKPERGKQRV